MLLGELTDDLEVISLEGGTFSVADVRCQVRSAFDFGVRLLFQMARHTCADSANCSVPYAPRQRGAIVLVNHIGQVLQAVLMDEFSSVIAESAMHHVSIVTNTRSVAAAGARAERKTPKQVRLKPLCSVPSIDTRTAATRDSCAGSAGEADTVSHCNLQRALSKGLSIAIDAEHAKHFGVPALAISAPQNHSVVRKDDPLHVHVSPSSLILRSLSRRFVRPIRSVRVCATAAVCTASALHCACEITLCSLS